MPLVQQLRAREAAEGQRIAAPGRPVILIVLPTNELSAQVCLSKHPKHASSIAPANVPGTGGAKRWLTLSLP